MLILSGAKLRRLFEHLIFHPTKWDISWTIDLFHQMVMAHVMSSCWNFYFREIPISTYSPFCACVPPFVCLCEMFTFRCVLTLPAQLRVFCAPKTSFDHFSFCTFSISNFFMKNSFVF